MLPRIVFVAQNIESQKADTLRPLLSIHCQLEWNHPFKNMSPSSPVHFVS